MTQTKEAEAVARPVRLQLSRRKGFNLQEVSRAANGLAALKVTRPGDLGNPFRITGPVKYLDGSGKVEWWVERDGGIWRFPTKAEAQIAAVEMFRKVVNMPGAEKFRAHVKLALRNVNPACNCRLGDPCHADVLLEIATPHPATRSGGE